MARPSTPIPAPQVALLAGLGLSAVAIADFYGVSRATIHRRHAEALARGHERAAAAVAAKAGEVACFTSACALRRNGSGRLPRLR